MIKYDFKKLPKAISKYFDLTIVVAVTGSLLSIVGGVMIVQMAFAGITPAIVPIELVPYNVHDFEFEESKYPGIKIPLSVSKDYNKELRCMARNLYFESRDQDLQGRIAVGLVTLNRVNNDNFPNSVCEVVWQKRWSKRYSKWVAQFSWTLDGKSDTPIEKEAYAEAVRLATALFAGGITDFTKGADHYHADYVNPSWAKKLILVTKIDDHIFYLEPPFKK